MYVQKMLTVTVAVFILAGSMPGYVYAATDTANIMTDLNQIIRDNNTTQNDNGLAEPVANTSSIMSNLDQIIRDNTTPNDNGPVEPMANTTSITTNLNKIIQDNKYNIGDRRPNG